MPSGLVELLVCIHFLISSSGSDHRDSYSASDRDLGHCVEQAMGSLLSKRLQKGELLLLIYFSHFSHFDLFTSSWA